MAGLKQALGALVAGSLMFSSTAVVAATPTAPIATQQVNPWAALAVLSAGAPAATICGGTAAAAAQAGAGCVLPVMDAAPPPPPPAVAPMAPVAVAGSSVGLNPLALGLLALVAGIGLYLAVRGGGSNNNGNTPT